MQNRHLCRSLVLLLMPTAFLTDPNIDAMTPLDLPDLAGAPLGGSCELPCLFCTGIEALARLGCCRWPCSRAASMLYMAAAPKGPEADDCGAPELCSPVEEAP